MNITPCTPPPDYRGPVRSSHSEYGWDVEGCHRTDTCPHGRYDSLTTDRAVSRIHTRES